MTHLPIACTLGAADFADREAVMAQLGRDALVSAERDAARARLRFAADAGIRDRVDSFVAAESSCCAFLTMRVEEIDDEIVLSIEAPDDAQPVLAEMVDAFDPARGGVMAQQPKARRDAGWLAAGGLLMVLCCAIGPAVIGAVAGTAIGGWLGIACAVVLAAVVGLVLHRRARSSGC
jgi:hypothetical protein